MGFMVYPPALRTAAVGLGDAAQAARVAGGYLSRNGRLSWHGQGPVSVAIGAHDDFTARLDQRLRHLVDLLSAANAELVKAAALYEHSDAVSAAAIDATYPPVARPAGRSPAQTTGL
jgi:uncharacterized protein YukE